MGAGRIQRAVVEFFKANGFFVFNIENTRKVAGSFIRSGISLSEELGGVVH